MSPTKQEIAGACFVDPGFVAEALRSLRNVYPELFIGVTQVKQLVTPKDKMPYMRLVDDYPPAVVAGVVKVLENMGNDTRRHNVVQLKDFSRRKKYGKVDVRPILHIVKKD